MLTTSLATERISERAVLHLASRLNQLHCHSLLIARNNHLAFEAYWRPYQRSQRQIVFSISKSFTAVALMFAVQEGIVSLDTRLCDILQKYIDFEPEPQMQKVTLHHLLSMSFGFVDTEIQQFYLCDDWIKEALALHLTNEPGSTFFYDNRCPFLCGAILQELTGLDLLSYLKPRLLKPLKITDIAWEKNCRGFAKGAWGLSLRSRDLLKFGLFLLNGGTYQNKKLLQTKYVNLMLTPHIKTLSFNDPTVQDNSGYGYYFWQCPPRNAYRAAGLFGQYCILLPQTQTVIVTTAGAEAFETPDILHAIWDFAKEMHSGTRVPLASTNKKLLHFIHSLKVPLPANNNKSDYALFDNTFYFSDNPLHLKALRLEPASNNQIYIDITLAERAFELRADCRRWLKNTTFTGRNEPFDSCQTIFYENPYAAYGWQDGRLVLSLAYTQAPFIDTFYFQHKDGKLRLQYLPMPNFPVRSQNETIFSQ